MLVLFLIREILFYVKGGETNTMNKYIAKSAATIAALGAIAQMSAGSALAQSFTINVIRPTGTIQNINKLVQGAILLIFLVAGLTAFVFLLLGGIKWITSGGDKGKVEEARSQIVQALIGLIVVLAAWGMIWLMQSITGACFGIGCDIVLPVFS